MKPLFLTKLFVFLIFYYLNTLAQEDFEMTNQIPTLSPFDKSIDINFSSLTSGTVTVKTSVGKIKGQIIRVFDKKVYFFNSIPYAKPPVGERRFKRPEPLESWSGVYDATRDKPICYQTFIPSLPVVTEQAEDCLFLNIWTRSLSTKTKMHVMVWFSGGVFIVGSATQIYQIVYQGKYLASENVVIVSMNYRLGNLGFVYDGTEEAPGNVGLFDQLLALKWVQKNIKYFGGDPKQVTIFGQSAGSWSVGLHMISPLSKNLFKQAIFESGSPYLFIGKTIKNSNALLRSKEIAISNKCFGPDWIKCLKKVPAKKVLSPFATFTDLPIPTLVVNEFIPDGIINAMIRGKFNKNKDIIAGVTDGDGSIFALIFLLPFTDKIINPTFILGRIHLALELVKLHWGLKNMPTAIECYNEYYGDLKGLQRFDTNLLKMRFSDFAGDFLLVCPTYLQIKDYKKKSPKSTVYFYMLTHRPKIPLTLICLKKWMRTCHADDIPLVFGAPLSFPLFYTRDDYQVSLEFKYLWTNYAKTGNPFSEKPPESLEIQGFERWPNIRWIKYNPKKPVKALNLNPRNISYITNPWTRCDKFWSKYFYNN